MVARRSVGLAASLLAALVAVGCSSAHEGADEAGSAIAWRGPDTFGLETEGLEELDVGNAYWLARLSDVAYRSAPEAARALADIGLGDAEMVFFENPETHTQALYVGLPEAGVLAFRGTEAGAAKDLLTDAKAWRTSTRLGEIHAGFFAAFRSVWEDSAEVLANGVPSRGIASHLRTRHWRGPDETGAMVSPRPLFLTGHSLGGALATIAAAHAKFDGCLAAHPAEDDPLWRDVQSRIFSPECLAERIDARALYTFGAPRAADTGFNVATNFYTGPSVFRFVNANDLVTKVPDSGYIHAARSRQEVDGLVYLTKAGDIDVGGRSTEYQRDSWRARILERLGDHGVANYVDKLRARAGEGKPAARLTPRRAFVERMKAAYLAPTPPKLMQVNPVVLTGAAKAAFERPSVTGGPKTAYVWSFETGVYLVREEVSVGVTLPDGSSAKQTRLRVQFFDGDSEPLVTAWGTASTFVWHDPADAKSSR